MGRFRTASGFLVQLRWIQQEAEFLRHGDNILPKIVDPMELIGKKGAVIVSWINAERPG
jgi:hypothetical protein